MKRVTRTLILLLLCAALCCSLLLPAIAADKATEGECGVDGANLTWRLDKNGVLTISGGGKMKDYTFDSHAPWYEKRGTVKEIKIEEDVTSIGNYAFDTCGEAAKVTIPSSVTRIGESAFSGCQKLKAVTIPESVSVLGPYIFNDCRLLTTAGPIGSGCSIEFGWTRSIPDYALHYCTALNKITLPAGIASIGAYAFEYCVGVEEMKIPEGVKSIGKYAFAYESELKTVSLPKTLTSIGDCAFLGCTRLQHADYPGTLAECNQIKVGKENEALTRCEVACAGGFVFGDVNLDTRIDSDDAMLILRYDVKKLAADKLLLPAGDVNKDGRVDSDDAMLILRYDVKKISKFPADE